MGHRLIDKPSPGARQKTRGDEASGLVVFVPGDDRAPRRFGDQQQPVQMGITRISWR